jgi:hypothetical protein
MSRLLNGVAAIRAAEERFRNAADGASGGGGGGGGAGWVSGGGGVMAAATGIRRMRY